MSVASVFVGSQVGLNRSDALSILRDGIVSAMTSMQEAIINELRARSKPAS